MWDSASTFLAREGRRGPLDHELTSLWRATLAPKFDALRGRVHVDVAIIGAGIAGLTAAMLLKSRGRSVALIEKNRVGNGEPGNTTAHITKAVDARYHTIVRTFGKDAAKLVARASRASIEQIESFVRVAQRTSRRRSCST